MKKKEKRPIYGPELPKEPHFHNSEYVDTVDDEMVHTYTITEGWAWRLTTCADGTELLFRTDLDNIDFAQDMLWEPWNDPPPKIDEALWEKVPATFTSSIDRANERGRWRKR